MKKRFLAMLTLAVMALSLTACGGSKDTPPKSEGSTQTPETKTEAPAPANAIPIKIANYYADTHPMNQVLNDVFKPMIEEGTEGRYTVEIYSNNALGGEGEYTEGCRMGTVEACIAGVMLSDQYPALKVINFPWVFDDVESASALLNSEEISSILYNTMLDANLVYKGAVVNGARAISNNVRPINTLADCKGIKIRVPEVSHFVSNAKALGFNPVTMSMSEIFTSLQQGVIEAQENPPTTLLTSGWYEVQPYLAITNHQISLDWIAFNKGFYEGLSDEDRAVVDAACEALVAEELTAYVASAEADIATLEENGVAVTYPDRTEFKDAGAVVIDEFCDQYPAFKEIIEAVRGMQAQ